MTSCAHTLTPVQVANQLTGLLKVVNSSWGQNNGRLYVQLNSQKQILTTTSRLSEATTLKKLSVCFDNVLNQLCPASKASEDLYKEIMFYVQNQMTAECFKPVKKIAVGKGVPGAAKVAKATFGPAATTQTAISAGQSKVPAKELLSSPSLKPAGDTSVSAA